MYTERYVRRYVSIQIRIYTEFHVKLSIFFTEVIGTGQNSSVN